MLFKVLILILLTSLAGTALGSCYIFYEPMYFEFLKNHDIGKSGYRCGDGNWGASQLFQGGILKWNITTGKSISLFVSVTSVLQAPGWIGLGKS